MEAIYAINKISDSQLKSLLNLDRKSISTWVLNLRQGPAMKMLFTHSEPEEVHFDQIDWLISWKPQLAKIIGTLPPLSTPADYPMNLTLKMQGALNLAIYSNAYDRY